MHRVGDLFPWEGKPFRGLHVGDRVKYMGYNGCGLNGPEYRATSGTVRLTSTEHVIVVSSRNRLPVVVDANNIID